MLLDPSSLISLIIFLVIAVILIIVCIYCCTCKPAWANTRRQIINRQIAEDEVAIDQEREAYRDQLRDTFSANQQARNDIRDKYQLR
jgi:uncharacterized membrane protein